MTSINDILNPEMEITDDMLPELESEEPFETIENVDEKVDEALVELVAEISSYPIVMITDLMVELTDTEFKSKHMKYKSRAMETGFAKNVAKYLEEYAPDWMDDPRIMLLFTGLMYFGYVAIDVKKTIELKRRENKAVNNVKSEEEVKNND